MRLTLSPEGETSNVRVIRSSGSAAIDKAAVAWMNGQLCAPYSSMAKRANSAL